ncbi:hypothetical protein HanIR_Chr01g0009291 [Helianthus annuus]|nr:hypothetical protein HanIR_Chr01g0009291 [Helianthus annuus]
MPPVTAAVVLLFHGAVARCLRRSDGEPPNQIWRLGTTSDLIVPTLALITPLRQPPLTKTPVSGETWVGLFYPFIKDFLLSFLLFLVVIKVDKFFFFFFFCFGG